MVIARDRTAEREPRAARTSRSALRRWWRRRPVKRALVWTHRWSALVLGLALLVVTTSGVPLLWDQEISRAQHADAYREAGPATMSFADVAPIVTRHDGSFRPDSLYRTHGVVVAENFDTGRRVTVDPSNGKVLGDFNPVKDTGAVTWTMGLMVNIHLCMLTCEEYPGYQKWISEPVPGTSWLGFEGEKVTWGGLLLGVTGALLLFLALSGIWLWWPGVTRWVVGVRVRWRRGRYARDFDLHQVAGMIAVPLLLAWAVTGMGYEFGFVEKAWYQVLPGEARPEVTFESAESEAPDIGVAAAVAAAQRAADTTSEPTAVDLPVGKEPTSTYGVWLADGFDPWYNSDYSGDMLVSVDRHTGGTAVTYGGPDDGTAQVVWQDWNFPTHAGWIVDPWWRVIWAVLGLTPLLLAITGLSTWFYKRGVRKRRQQAVAAA